MLRWASAAGSHRKSRNPPGSSSKPPSLRKNEPLPHGCRNNKTGRKLLPSPHATTARRALQSSQARNDRPMPGADIRVRVDGNTEFIAWDNPHATRLTLHILAAVTEHEREAISGSLPSRERGSKRFTRRGALRRSLPSRGRGSKRYGQGVIRRSQGARTSGKRGSLPSRGRGSKQRTQGGRPLPGARSNWPGAGWSPLHGGADRNSAAQRSFRAKGRPFTGARIETLQVRLVPWRFLSLPSRGRRSKQDGARITVDRKGSRSLHGGADRNCSVPLDDCRGRHPGRSLHGWFSFSSARRMVATLSADAAARFSAVQRMRDRAALI